MKRILLLSDTHSYLGDEIIKHIKQADEVWHAGDIGNVSVTDTIKKIKPLRAVYGNIDGAELRKEFPENLIFTIDECKIFMTHIGGYPGKYPTRIKKIIQTEKPNVFICGHSHILKVMYDSTYEVLTLNPGAIGISGFHHKRTMLRLVIEKSEIKDLAVIEFDR